MIKNISIILLSIIIYIHNIYIYILEVSIRSLPFHCSCSRLPGIGPGAMVLRGYSQRNLGKGHFLDWKSPFSMAMDWLKGTSIQETHGFLPSNLMGFPVKIVPSSSSMTVAILRENHHQPRNYRSVGASKEVSVGVSVEFFFNGYFRTKDGRFANKDGIS